MKPLFRKRCRLLISGILVSSALLACTGPSPALRIKTNVPEVTLLAEVYGTKPGTPLIQVEYEEHLTVPEDGSVDILIGRGLNNMPTIELLSGFDDLFKNELLASTDYYDFTFQKYRNETRLAILAFDLPAIISRIPSSSADFEEGVLLPLDQLAQKSAPYNVVRNGSLRSVGFSPLYSQDFLFLVTQYQKASFGGDNLGYPTWNESNLRSALEYLTAWSKQNNSGADAEHAFILKYAYDPVFQLINQSRFSYAYSKTSDFLKLSESIAKNLTLYFPSTEGKILILDDFVAAGVPQRSSRKQDAYDFLRWILGSDAQNRAITGIIDTGLYAFGFLGGFSTNRLITEHTIPLYYPRIRLRIPPEGALIFPQQSAWMWHSFKTEILGPWLLSQVIESQQPLDRLSQSAEQWLKHHGRSP